VVLERLGGQVEQQRRPAEDVVGATDRRQPQPVADAVDRRGHRALQGAEHDRAQQLVA
jgi:hypothetical protein